NSRLPLEFTRQPRKLKYLIRWKVKEFRSFLLYLGPIALKGNLDRAKYNNFLTLHVAMSILLNPKSIRDEALRNYARSLLIHFVQTFTNIYNESFITNNFHGLIHLVDDADYFSKIITDNQFSLEYISAFQFENYLQKIKTMFKIKIESPNDICGSKSGDIIKVENICFVQDLNNCIIVGRKFLRRKDFFIMPCTSSSIGVYEVDNNHMSDINIWKILNSHLTFYRKWTLIHLYEENGDNSPDLIPNEWMLSDYSCWYPKNFKLSTIKAYAKRKENPNQDYYIKTNILDNYEYGIKLIYKVNKHLNNNSLDHSLNLHSEVEERGRGQRTKQKKNRQEPKQNMSIFDVDDDHSNSDEVDNHDTDDFGGETSVKRTNLVMYPEFPKKQKVTHRNEKVYYLSNNTPSKSRYQDNTSITDRTVPAVSMVTDIFCECKLSKKLPHSCTFGTPNLTNVSLLEVIGHQLCRLSADILKIKNYTNYIKQDLSSFIDNDGSSRNNNQWPEKIILENSILSSFPLNNENELLSIEKNLQSEDLGYSVHASEGKTITKVTNSILRTVISDDFAKEYSWKGQKNKNLFKDLTSLIIKIIIG
ncbi:Uncharacterized protein FWK35_00030705, partial [Aphis craccivora]